MDITAAKVAIIVNNYFEEAEFTEPLRVLKEAGVQVDVVSSHGKTLRALKHAEPAGAYQADIVVKDINDIDINVYDAVVLPGGAINADHLRMEEWAQQWVIHFMAANKLVAAICHAPWVLVSADVVRGRTLTSYFTIQDDIRNAGGMWVDQEVAVDHNLITSRKPDDLPAFYQAILDALREQQK